MGAIGEWTLAQQRVSALVAAASEADVSRPVPACPAWTARDLLSHMIGLNADVVAGDEPDDHNSAWTARQVEERRGRNVAALLQEWQALVEPMRSWMVANGPRPLGDILIHEQDLRGALGVPGAKDTPGLRSLGDRFVTGFGAQVASLPPITLDGGEFRWTSATAGEAPAVVVRAPDFELIRALMSRRSASQLRAWTIIGDIEPYLSAFGTLGSLPDSDLHE